MSHDYAILLERLAEEDGGGWMATVPHLPGCMSDGETPEAALRNVDDAITAWLQAAREWNVEVAAPVLAKRA